MSRMLDTSESPHGAQSEHMRALFSELHKVYFVYMCAFSSCCGRRGDLLECKSYNRDAPLSEGRERCMCGWGGGGHSVYMCVQKTCCDVLHLHSRSVSVPSCTTVKPIQTNLIKRTAVY